MYASSLREFGTPKLLEQSNGWLLEREIAGSGWRDAIGCYPLFACRDYALLHADLAAYGNQWVSVGFVPDPLTCCPMTELQSVFEHVRAFEEHFLVRISEFDEVRLPKHHRYYARRALRTITVERAAEPVAHLDEWVRLYGNLVARHQLSGIQAFSRKAFEVQLQIPGLVMLRAIENGVAVGAHLWFIDEERGYSHLMALSERGYELSASYALYHEALLRSGELLSSNVKVLNLGGGAGSGPFPKDGLTHFKQGWSTERTLAYFCGKILNPKVYEELVSNQPPQSDYFPAYRFSK